MTNAPSSVPPNYTRNTTWGFQPQPILTFCYSGESSGYAADRLRERKITLEHGILHQITEEEFHEMSRAAKIEERKYKFTIEPVRRHQLLIDHLKAGKIAILTNQDCFSQPELVALRRKHPGQLYFLTKFDSHEYSEEEWNQIALDVKSLLSGKRECKIIAQMPNLD